jgi:parallel beta-helix repeat protein
MTIGNSGNSTLTSNTITNNTGTGISFWYSGNNTILNNTLVNNGIYLEGDRLRDFLQVSVTNNSVNGKPIVYWQNIIGGIIPNGTGQVILVNSSSIEVTGLTLSELPVGLLAVFCSELFIHDNVFFNNREMGIYISFSEKNTLTNNTINNNGWNGITLDNSGDSTLTHNAVTNNSWTGIDLRNSRSSTLTHNTVTNNSF